KGTPFQLNIWRALLHIPEGSLWTYSALAQAAGKPKAIRAVGSAIGKNPIALLIPCHRVIRTSGALGGYRWGVTRKSIINSIEASKRL
ncbi:MAG: MGMT family protein, partial [Bacteroidota bacterium]